MSQPDGERIVRYKAVADFSQLFIEAAAAEARLRALQAEANKLGGRGGAHGGATPAQVTADLTRHTQAVERDGAALTRHSTFQERFTHSLAQTSAEMRKQETHEERLGALRRKNAETLRQQQAQGGLKGDDRLRANVARDLADMEKLGAMARSLSEKANQDALRTSALRGSLSNRAAADIEKLTQLRLSGARRVAADEAREARTAEQHLLRMATLNQRAQSQQRGPGLFRGIFDVVAGFGRAGAAGVRAAKNVEGAWNRTRNAMVSASRSLAGSAVGGSGGGFIGGFNRTLNDLGDWSSGKLGKFMKAMLSFRGLIVLAVATLGPLIATLGALGGAAIGAANILVSLGGSVAVLPGLFLAAATGIGALITAVVPMMGVFKAFQAQQKLLTVGTAQLAQAHHDAAQKVADAQHAYQDASKNVVDAQFSEQRAQLSLNDARQQATRDLQDMRTELSRASLNEEGAILNLRQAQLDYRKSLADSNATMLDRQQALYRVKVAENDLSDVRTKNTRLAQDTAVAERRGVEGSEQVIGAKKAVADANAAAATATYQLQKASYDLALAQKEQAAGGQQLYQANQELEAQLGKLGPNARKVALSLLGQSDAWHAIQKRVGEGIFTPVSRELGRIPTALGIVNTLLGKSADAIGAVVGKGLEMVTSGPWVSDFGRLADSNATIIGKLGDAALFVASAFKDIAVAAIPFTEWISGAVRDLAKNFADWADSARRSGAIADFLRTTEERLTAVSTIVNNIWTLFSSLFFASNDFSGGLLNDIVKITDKWAAWGQTQAETGSTFRNWLDNIKPLLHSVWSLVEQFAIAFGKIAADPRNIQEAQRILDALANKVLPSLVGIFGKLSESHAISNIAKGLGSLFGSIERFLNNGGSLVLTTFFGSLITLLAGIAWVLSQPGIAQGLGYLITGLSFLAAISVIGKYTGLFKLIDYLARLAALRGGLQAVKGVLKDFFTGKALGTTAAAQAAATPMEAAADTMLIAARAMQAAADTMFVSAELNQRAAVGQDAAAVATTRGAGVARAGGAVAGGAATAGTGLLGGLAARGLTLGPIAAIAAAVFLAVNAIKDGLTQGGKSGAQAGNVNDMMPASSEFAKNPGLGTGAKALIEINPLVAPFKVAAFEIRRFFSSDQIGKMLTAAKTYLEGRYPGLFVGIQTAWNIAWQKLESLPVVGRVMERIANRITTALGGNKTEALGKSVNGIGPALEKALKSLGPSFSNMIGLFDTLSRKTKTSNEVAEAYGATLDNIGKDNSISARDGLSQYSLMLDTVNDANLTANARAGVYSQLLDSIAANASSQADKIAPLTKAFNDIAAATLDASTKADLLRRAWDQLKDPAINAYEATDNLATAEDNLKDAVAKSATTIDKKTGHVKNNKDAIVDAAKAARDAYFAEIAQGDVSEAVARQHLTDNLARLDKEVGGTGKVKAAVKELFDIYAAPPPQTELTVDISGLDKAMAGMEQLIVAQYVVAHPNEPDVLIKAYTFAARVLQTATAFANAASVYERAGKPVEKGSLVPRTRGDQSGGLIEGTYDGRVDTEHRRLTIGEFVTRKRVVDKPYAKQVLRDLNEERLDPADFYAALNLATSPRAAYFNPPPRVSGASIVNNNSTSSTRNAGLHVGDVTINNPVRERSDRSMRRTLQTLAYLHDK